MKKTTTRVQPEKVKPKNWLGWVVGGICFIFFLTFLISVNSRIRNIKGDVARIDSNINEMQKVDSNLTAADFTLTNSVNSLWIEIGDVKTIAENAQFTADSAQSKAGKALQTANQAKNVAENLKPLIAAKADTNDMVNLGYTLNNIDSALDSYIIKVEEYKEATDSLAKMVKNDSARLDNLEARLEKINVETDFLILREATRYAEAYAIFHRTTYNPTFAQDFIDATSDKRRAMWEAIKSIK